MYEIQALVDSLADPYREVVVEHYLHERTIAETAEFLDLREGTVKSRLNKALRILEQKLES